MTEERCEKCAHFHRLKHNFKKGIGFEESTCCDVLLHLPDSTDDTKPWVQEVSRLGMCEMFTEVKQDKQTTKNDLTVDAVSRQAVLELIADNDLSMGQVVRGIHALTSVTPQEPILDKIRAEIEQARYGLVNDGLDIALNIIDKYKAEAENP